MKKENESNTPSNEETEATIEGFYSSPRVSSELPDCSMPLTFDQYSKCSMHCKYCFALAFKNNNPAYRGKPVPLKAANIDKLIKAIEGHPDVERQRMLYRHFYSRKFLFHWGGLADPFCSYEKKNREGLRLMKVLGEENYPTLFSFKGTTIFERDYIKLFERYAKQSNFAFQISIVTNSDKLSKQVEIGVPVTSRRLEAIRTLSAMGYWCILRLRPFILGITDIGLDELLDRALEAGISGISTEFFALDARTTLDVKRNFSQLGEMMGVKNLQQYFSALSPSERGSYFRLNRIIKESYVKQIYKFCTENDLVCGISDPDFKELNTSGSCCAMPNHFPKNRGLENWTKNQLTFHLKRARQRFHKTGKDQLLYFNEVYGTESYLEDPILTRDHVSDIGMPMAVRYVRTLRHILQGAWNNLDSPANPRNYLAGKILPIGTDNDENIIYKYNPLEYEIRWVNEGIDLTR